MGLLDQKICVVTGGAGSIGAATVRAFLAEGAKVMIVDLEQTRLDALAASLTGANIMTHAGDIADLATVEAFLARTVTAWGKIDVLVSNAGNPGHVAALDDYPDEAFDRTLHIHAKGAYLACKYGALQMRDGGSIVVTSSITGVRGGSGQNIAYAAAKHAQVGIVRAAARALAPRNIRVNSINPGPVDNAFQTGIENDMSKLSGIDVTVELNKTVPLGRHAHPDEIASVVLFLASSMSSYITGSVQMIDGGIMS
jgi:NAD(P)-dependent dehydrogenase (short-subunit alcohol dehydrogenase family)